MPHFRQKLHHRWTIREIIGKLEFSIIASPFSARSKGRVRIERRDASCCRCRGVDSMTVEKGCPKKEYFHPSFLHPFIRAFDVFTPIKRCSTVVGEGYVVNIFSGGGEQQGWIYLQWRASWAHDHYNPSVQIVTFWSHRYPRRRAFRHFCNTQKTTAISKGANT